MSNFISYPLSTRLRGERVRVRGVYHTSLIATWYHNHKSPDPNGANKKRPGENRFHPGLSMLPDLS
jgi:hypothetical protein